LPPLFGLASQHVVQAGRLIVLRCVVERLFKRDQAAPTCKLRARVHDVGFTLAGAASALAHQPDRVKGNIAWCDLFAPGLSAHQQSGCCGGGILYQFFVIIGTNNNRAGEHGNADARENLFNQ
jgi:hypothetical protein